jgi:hypothetical protein
MNLQLDLGGCHTLKNKLLLRAAAGVAKLADAPDLGSGAARHVGSTPITRTY